ncbi:TRAP transporter permease [Orrella marina]|uniref:C4-dicarboxylate ABC transporter permease n=1 Tax=Orrella marina TaxID=2163011 RepID=A0A2R4XFP4_9BURK|nr:TRAP transporter permease [Orrella marina]AWB32637.1 C4-dicarboxylate ABC transporter permease [Orrella marina]
MSISRKISIHGSLVTTICLTWCIFQLYTGVFGVFPAQLQRSIHLAFAITLIFLLRDWKGRKRSGEGDLVGQIFWITISLIPLIYIAVNYEQLWVQTETASDTQMVLSLMLVIGLLEATRRTVGNAVPIIAIVFIIYSRFGEMLPGILAHINYSIYDIVQYQVLGLQGIFGVALGVMATFVFLFILYAAVLNVSGAGELFIAIATRYFGGVRGGPAKTAVAASCLFGSISGSAVANVAGTGTFTIPLMKRTGFKPSFAGAVEAVASTGGQFMPPLMGASAFLVAEVTSTPFWQVALAATIPALLYYFAVLLMVDFEAGKTGLKGIPKSELPLIGPLIKKNWHLLISPLCLLFFLLIMHWSAMKAAVWTIGVTFLTMVINPNSRLTFSQCIEMARQGALGTIEVSIACATIGIVIGAMAQTGLGFQLSSVLIELAGGQLWLLLILTMLTSLVLGMGLPTVAAYLVLSVTVAPALVALGVHIIAAHLFIFYFGIISAITPPVALASFVAAGIAQERIWPTSMTAVRLGSVAFLIPFVFVYDPALIMEGSISDIVWRTFIAVCGTLLWAAGLQRFLIHKMGKFETTIALFTAVLLIAPYIYTDLVGLAIFGLLVTYNLFLNKSKPINV